MELTALGWLPACTKPCLCLQEWALSRPADLQGQVLWAFMLGSVTWGSGPDLVRTALIPFFSSLWAAHLVDIGFDCAVKAPLLPSRVASFFSLNIKYHLG